MSIIVNTKKVKVYELDNRETVIIRISSEFDTLPKYLVFSGDLDPMPKKVDAIDILELIRIHAKNSANFQDFLDKNSDVLGKASLNVKKDILDIWIAYNKPIQQFLDIRVTEAVNEIGKELVGKGYFKLVSEFNKIIAEKNTIIQRLEREIKNNKKKEISFRTIYGTLNSIEEKSTTKFRVESSELVAILDLEQTSLLEIFNSTRVNTAIPLVKCKDYYKILKNYLPPEEWSDEKREKREKKGVEKSEKLLLKVNEKIEVKSDRYKDYTDVGIKIEENVVKAKLKVNRERGNLTQDKFLERVAGSFSPSLKYKSVEESELLGVFYFPPSNDPDNPTAINTFVFSDLAMNNDLFSSFIEIDEHVKATKKGGEEKNPWLRIHFNSNITGHIVASITQKVVDRKEPEMKEEDFTHGEPYIEVKCQGNSIKSIDNFRKILGKLMKVYDEKIDEIVEEYRQYIPDFGEIFLPELPKMSIEQDKASDVFVKNYSRYCPKERNLTIIPGEEIDNYKGQGKQVLLFPRNKPENGPSFPSDGKNQHYYVCNNPNYPYPGLKVNNLSNAEQFPFIPCCYKSDQTKQGNYVNYYQGNGENKNKVEIREKKQQDLIITDKILGPEKHGVIPEELKKFFQALDLDTEYSYIRIGVIRDYNSFLSCVAIALYEQTGILNVPENKRAGRIAKLRKRLAQKYIAVMAKQCCYDSSLEEIVKNLEDENSYLDPKLYTQLLESYFNCNIFLFNREQLFLPRFSQSYYKFYRDTPSIFIYEHLGSESDRAKYPQCELIIRWNTKTKDDTQYSFPNEQEITKNVKQVFNSLNESFVLNREIKEIYGTDLKNLIIKSQYIDGYGKTRLLNIEHKGVIFSILTSPLPPLATEETDSTLLYTDMDTALDFISSIDAPKISQGVYNGAVYELNTLVGEITVSICVNGGEPQEDLEIVDTSHIPSQERSALVVFNKNKKLARYVTEYVFWSFSRYIREGKIEKITDKVLATFAKNKFRVQEGYVYKNIKKFFGKGNILDGDKIVVQSEEMLKRLLYVLKLYSIRNLKSLLSYADRTAISEFYVDITDFDTQSDSVILQGEDSIDKWIQNNKANYILSNSILLGQPEPYFFKNKLVDNSENIYLAQNAIDLKTAMNISIFWNKYGYNPGIYPEIQSEENYSFTLYSYINSDNIKSIHVAGLPNKLDIKIVGYKVGSISAFTSLLPLRNL